MTCSMDYCGLCYWLCWLFCKKKDPKIFAGCGHVPMKMVNRNGESEHLWPVPRCRVIFYDISPLVTVAFGDFYQLNNDSPKPNLVW